MLCPKCGTEMRQDNVCPNCGYVNIANVGPPPNTNQNRISPLKIIGCIFTITIAIILWMVGCNLQKQGEDMKNGRWIPSGYSYSIQSSTPTGYNMTYGQGFDKYFDSTKWEDITINGSPAVKFTGILNTGNGTYSKAEVIFGITDMNDGQFYYSMDQVILDGVDVGTIGAYGLMEEVFGNGSPF